VARQPHSNDDMCQAVEDGQFICSDRGQWVVVKGEIALAKARLCELHQHELTQQGKVVYRTEVNTR